MSVSAYKVLLPTSGTGSRLKDITKKTNKALVPINDKPAITYILDSYPKEVPIVVTLGYLGESVKTFLEDTYPDRTFEFVWVDKYEGFGSSLGYSLLKARDYLQCPFIFHACDGIFVEKIPEPTENWIGGFVDDWNTTNLPLAEYTSHTMENEAVLRINPRGATGFDSLHIGLDGINDYAMWWETLANIYQANPGEAQLSDVHVLNKMLERHVAFKWVPFNVWLDTGNLSALKRTETYFSSYGV